LSYKRSSFVKKAKKKFFFNPLYPPLLEEL